MKNRIPALLWMVAVTAVLIAALGAWLKYGVLRPLELYQDEPVMAVPFLLMANEEDHYILQKLHQEETPETVPEETQPPVTEVPETQPPTQAPTEAPTEPPTEAPTEPTETEPVVIEESWFDDALFIGDSRTQGLSMYARLGQAQYFCEVGMTVYNVQSSRCSDEDYGKTYLSDLLSENSYGKVYINLGLNEIGHNREKTLEKYQELIDLIQEKQPDATIVLQGIMTLGRKKAASQDYFSLDSIHLLNQDIQNLADAENLFYIDVNEWIADEEGYLPDELSGDGCHLYGSEYDDWARWIMDNAATLEIQ